MTNMYLTRPMDGLGMILPSFPFEHTQNSQLDAASSVFCALELAWNPKPVFRSKQKPVDPSH